MLEISMADGAPPLYNEVVVDSQAYLQSLPHSIAAVAYYDDSTEEEQIKATETYLAMLQAYELTVDDIPLVKLIREPAEGQPHLEDASAGAEAFLGEQRYQTFRREHPKLGLPPHQRASLSAAPDQPAAAQSDRSSVAQGLRRVEAEAHVPTSQEFAAEANLERAVAEAAKASRPASPAAAVSPNAVH